jgi:hypothetical protein
MAHYTTDRYIGRDKSKKLGKIKTTTLLMLLTRGKDGKPAANDISSLSQPV